MRIQEISNHFLKISIPIIIFCYYSCTTPEKYKYNEITIQKLTEDLIDIETIIVSSKIKQEYHNDSLRILADYESGEILITSNNKLHNSFNVYEKIDVLKEGIITKWNSCMIINDTINIRFEHKVFQFTLSGNKITNKFLKCTGFSDTLFYLYSGSNYCKSDDYNSNYFNTIVPIYRYTKDRPLVACIKNDLSMVPVNAYLPEEYIRGIDYGYPSFPILCCNNGNLVVVFPFSNEINIFDSNDLKLIKKFEIMTKNSKIGECLLEHPYQTDNTPYYKITEFMEKNYPSFINVFFDKTLLYLVYKDPTAYNLFMLCYNTETEEYLFDVALNNDTNYGILTEIKNDTIFSYNFGYDEIESNKMKLNKFIITKSE